MHWLYLLAALACFGLAMRTGIPTWAVLGLIVTALGLLVAWMLGWMASRLAGVSRNDAQMISVEDLRRLREQAEARKQAAEAARGDAPQ
jgi:hypothetical protein